MTLTVPAVLASVLAGLGVYALLARRNAVMLLIGAELLVNAGVLILVLADLRFAAVGRPGHQSVLSGQVGALFAITIAAAEIGLALAVVLLLFRRTGSVDLTDDRTAPEQSR